MHIAMRVMLFCPMMIFYLRCYLFRKAQACNPKILNWMVPTFGSQSNRTLVATITVRLTKQLNIVKTKPPNRIHDFSSLLRITINNSIITPFNSAMYASQTKI